MSNKLSFSKISSYSICGERYRLRYEEGLQEKWSRASLLFGSAMDKTLNNLLEKRNLAEAKAIFEKEWAFGWINKKLTPLMGNPNMLYSNSDYDKDLVDVDAESQLHYDSIADAKKSKTWEELDEADRIFYNTMNWESLRVKGHIIIDSYFTKVLPQFVRVTAIQHEAHLVNSAGDTLIQYLDFVAELADGSVVLFDNKTTSNLMYYDDDAPGTSQQLVSYYFNNKEEFGLTAVGFVAMQKQIIKNKTKICSKCNHDGSEGSARTCDQEYPGIVQKRGKDVEALVRCKGDWIVDIDPECAIKIIVNPVTEAAVDLVMSTFDEANNGITNKIWYKNLNVCKNIYGSPCEYYNHCWKGDDSDLIKKA